MRIWFCPRSSAVQSKRRVSTHAPERAQTRPARNAFRHAPFGACLGNLSLRSRFRRAGEIVCFVPDSSRSRRIYLHFIFSLTKARLFFTDRIVLGFSPPLAKPLFSSFFDHHEKHELHEKRTGAREKREGGKAARQMPKVETQNPKAGNQNHGDSWHSFLRGWMGFAVSRESRG